MTKFTSKREKSAGEREEYPQCWAVGSHINTRLNSAAVSGTTHAVVIRATLACLARMPKKAQKSCDFGTSFGESRDKINGWQLFFPDVTVPVA